MHVSLADSPLSVSRYRICIAVAESRILDRSASILATCTSACAEMMLLCPTRRALGAEFNSFSSSVLISKSTVSRAATFEVYFVYSDAPVLNHWLHLALDIVGDVIALFKQLLESKYTGSVLENRVGHLSDGLPHILQPIYREVRLSDCEVHARIHVDVDIVLCENHLPVEVDHIDTGVDLQKLLSHGVDVAETWLNYPVVLLEVGYDTCETLIHELEGTIEAAQHTPHTRQPSLDAAYTASTAVQHSGIAALVAALVP